jgi:hypothetical protein
MYSQGGAVALAGPGNRPKVPPGCYRVRLLTASLP